MITRRGLLGSATAAGVSALVRPARAAVWGFNFLYFHTPNGFYRPSFGADPGAANIALRPSLAPLAPWSNRLAVVSGLSNRASGGPPITRVLTCTSGPAGNRGFGTSVDTALGLRLGCRPLNLCVATPPEDGTRLSWSRGVENTPSYDVARAWDRVFGRGSTSVASAVTRQNSLDQALVRRFGYLGGELPSADALMIGQHLANRPVHQLSVPAGVPDRAELVARGAAAPDLGAKGRVMVDLALMAFQSGFSHSATIQWQPAGGGIDPTGSGKSHAQIAAAGDGPAQAAIDAWYAAEFAYVLERVAALGLMDTTVICWGSEVSQGADNQNNMTFVLAGGAALKLRNNVALNLPFVGKETDGPAVARQPANRPLADLWSTLLRAFGAADGSFGDPGRGTGPISGLLVGA